MTRGYQYDFSKSPAGDYDVLGRERKANTMVAILDDVLDAPLANLTLLNVGGSGGIIDNYLADYVQTIVSVDIDKPAIERAKAKFNKPNLHFQVGDALNLAFTDNSFDVLVCSQVYEHVPSPEKMMDEIYRVLKPGGVCYFAGCNRFMWNEPHHNLPLLSAIPRPLAHIYVRLAKKADYYYELHYSYWGLKKLVRRFVVEDYTKKIIHHPAKFGIEYMLKPGSKKELAAKLIVNCFYWLTPCYIWVLKKPND